MLEHKRVEIEELSKKFESKVRAKEEEQFQLKQDLTKLAVSINMEAQKKRYHQSETQRCASSGVSHL